MNKYELDERQLWIRGEAFKHGFIFLVFTICINGMLISDGNVVFENGYLNVVLVMVAVAICQLEMLFRDAVDFDNKQNKRVFYLLGFLGLVLLLLNLGHMFNSEYDIFAKKHILSDDVGFTLIGITLMVQWIVYIVKERHYKKKVD